MNQTLVKVMFQWKEPTMPVLIPPPPPCSDPILWLVGLWWERTRGPACSYTQPGIRAAQSSWIICQLAPIVPDGINVMFYIF